MAEIIENIKKDSKVQKEISQIIEKYNNESYATQARRLENASIQSKVFEQAKNIKGDTFEDMDIAVGPKDNKLNFLKNKIGLPHTKLNREMNKLGVIKLSSKRGDRILSRWTNSPEHHN